MENIIKNIHLISDQISTPDVERLTHGALQYRKFGRITFKILSIDNDTIKIQALQGKNPNENYADAKTLITRGKDLFERFFPDFKIIVNPVIFRESEVENVTPEYIRNQMVELKIKVKDIVADTGIDKTNVSAWANGTREMSQPVKAMFFYYFQQKEHEQKK